MDALAEVPVSAPVLFLDFDGVLNHSGTRETFNGFTGLDPANVARLNAICELAPSSRIVISSTWRRMYPLVELRGALAAAGFAYPDRVVSRTPHLNLMRGFEIEAWLETQAEQPAAFAILDDDDDMVHLTPHLVRTNPYDGGLSDADALAVAEKLAGGVR
jgi:hypothetical protein